MSFNDQMQRLRIPFAAIKVFADPGVEFGLQFTLEEDGEPQAAEVKLLGGAVAKRRGWGEDSPLPAGGAEIVTLDRFRKK